MEQTSENAKETSAPSSPDLLPIPTIEELERRRYSLQIAIDALKAKVKVREETEWRGGA
jgi:hypothetical protein